MAASREETLQKKPNLSKNAKRKQKLQSTPETYYKNICDILNDKNTDPFDLLIKYLHPDRGKLSLEDQISIETTLERLTGFSILPEPIIKSRIIDPPFFNNTVAARRHKEHSDLGIIQIEIGTVKTKMIFPKNYLNVFYVFIDENSLSMQLNGREHRIEKANHPHQIAFLEKTLFNFFLLDNNIINKKCGDSVIECKEKKKALKNHLTTASSNDSYDFAFKVIKKSYITDEEMYYFKNHISHLSNLSHQRKIEPRLEYYLVQLWQICLQQNHRHEIKEWLLHYIAKANAFFSLSDITKMFEQDSFKELILTTYGEDESKLPNIDNQSTSFKPIDMKQDKRYPVKSVEFCMLILQTANRLSHESLQSFFYKTWPTFCKNLEQKNLLPSTIKTKKPKKKKKALPLENIIENSNSFELQTQEKTAETEEKGKEKEQSKENPIKSENLNALKVIDEQDYKESTDTPSSNVSQVDVLEEKLQKGWFKLNQTKPNDKADFAQNLLQAFGPSFNAINNSGLFSKAKLRNLTGLFANIKRTRDKFSSAQPKLKEGNRILLSLNKLYKKNTSTTPAITDAKLTSDIETMLEKIAKNSIKPGTLKDLISFAAREPRCQESLSKKEQEKIIKMLEEIGFENHSGKNVLSFSGINNISTTLHHVHKSSDPKIIKTHSKSLYNQILVPLRPILEGVLKKMSENIGCQNGGPSGYNMCLKP